MIPWAFKRLLIPHNWGECLVFCWLSELRCEETVLFEIQEPRISALDILFLLHKFISSVGCLNTADLDDPTVRWARHSAHQGAVERPGGHATDTKWYFVTSAQQRTTEAGFHLKAINATSSGLEKHISMSLPLLGALWYFCKLMVLFIASPPLWIIHYAMPSSFVWRRPSALRARHPSLVWLVPIPLLTGMCAVAPPPGCFSAGCCSILEDQMTGQAVCGEQCWKIPLMLLLVTPNG